MHTLWLTLLTVFCLSLNVFAVVQVNDAPVFAVDPAGGGGGDDGGDDGDDDGGDDDGGDDDGGEEPLGAISGYKFNDLNGNSDDNNEPRLPGFQITLTNVGGETVERSTTTDSNGFFEFEDLPLQAYEICEIAPVATPPWVPTTPSCVSVDLDIFEDTADVVFGNQQTQGSLGCTRTQGYWGSSPPGQALLIQLVSNLPNDTLSLGSVSYTAGQLDDIFDESVGGNALINLAHQLISAKLNILNGASGTGIAATIAAADTAIGSLIVPPVGSGDVDPSSSLGQTMVNLANTLDQYNMGNSGVPHCR